MKKLIVYLLPFILIISCKEKVIEPTAEFAFTMGNDGNISFKSNAEHSDTYLWLFGDGTTSSEQNPTHEYKQNGNYTVMFTATGKGGKTTKEYQVTVSTIKPTTDFIVKNGSEGKISIDNLSLNAETYLWEFGDGGKSNEKNPTYVFKKNAKYVITLTATGKGGKSTLQKEITINSIIEIPVPTVTITANKENEGSVSFNSSTVNAESYLWDFGDGTTSSQKNPTHVYIKNGAYVVTLTAKGKGGETTKQLQLNIFNITGSVIFWMQSMKSKNIEVYVDGKYYGLIQGFYANGVAPDCGAQYSVTVNGLSEGSHLFTGKESNTVIPAKWSGTIEITGRNCSSVKLGY